MNALVPFLPRHVRQRYKSNGELKDPVMDELPFAVLGILDISGYSKLTTALSARGNIGAELLTRILNPYFTLMIETVEKYGGDIIKFAGDAIIVYWKPPVMDDEKTAKAITCMRACRASLLLLAALGNYEVAIPQDNAIKASEKPSAAAAAAAAGDKKEEKKDSNIIFLSMHIGLAYGKSFEVHVGLPGRRWEFFVAGEGIRKVAPILDEAKRGELAISADMMQMLKETPGVAPGYTANVTPEFGILKSLTITDEDRILPSKEETDSTVEPNEIHARYINESAVYRLTDGQAALLNELRHISVIFLKIGDLDYDSPKFLPMTQQALVIALNALQEFEGSLRQMMMDDKGLTILAVFGLPPWSHENESTFALKAALQMCDGMKKAGFTTFSFGVASGVVFTGKVGSELRCDHTVLGDCVNMAARLMCSKLAYSSILCDDMTYQASKQLFSFFTPDPILVKGKSFPIAVYKPEGERPQETRAVISAYDSKFAASFVGRHRERQLIQKMVEAQQFGPINAPSATLVLEGDSGQGKSRLGHFLINMALGAGMLVAFGQSSEVERKTPAQTLRPVVHALINIIGNESFKYNPQAYQSLRANDRKNRQLSRNESIESIFDDWADDGMPDPTPPAGAAASSAAATTPTASPSTSVPSVAAAAAGKPSPAGPAAAIKPSPLGAGVTPRDKRKESIMMQSALPSYRRQSNAFDAPAMPKGSFDPNLRGVDPSLLKDEAGLASDAPDLKSRVRRLSVQVARPPPGSKIPMLTKQATEISMRRGVPAARGKPSNLTGAAHAAALSRWALNDVVEDDDEIKPLGQTPASVKGSVLSVKHAGKPPLGMRLSSDTQQQQQEAIRPLASAATANVPDTSLNIVEADLSDLEKRVFTAMRRINESENFLSLLNLVLPVHFPKASMSFNRTRQSETDALVLVLARMILKIVASSAPLVIVLDDGHWQDSLTWYVLVRLVRLCSFRLLLCVISRPSKDFEEKLLRAQFDQLKAIKSSVVVNVDGLSREDMVQLMVQTYGNAIKSIQPDLAEKMSAVHAVQAGHF